MSHLTWYEETHMFRIWQLGSPYHCRIKKRLFKTATICFSLVLHHAHYTVTNAGYIYQGRTQSQWVVKRFSKWWVSHPTQVGKQPRPYNKAARSLDIFEITGRLWWHHFLGEVSPQLQCITMEFTEGMVQFRTLHPPGCPRWAVLVLLDTPARPPWMECASQRHFLLNFLPQICCLVDCNLPPLLSKPWRAGRRTQPGSF